MIYDKPLVVSPEVYDYIHDNPDIWKYLPFPLQHNYSVDQLVDLGIRAKKAYNDHMKDKHND